jgi:hypothetical protein
LVEERETRYRVDTLLARLMDNIPVLARPADTPAPSQSHEAGAQRQRRPRSHPHKGRVLLAIQANLAAHRSRGGGGGSVAERDLPYQVPELRYVEVEDQARLASMRVQSSNWWGVQIPIALCVRCEMRYTEDPNKDAYGIPIHDYPEDDLEVVCRDCQSAALSETLLAWFTSPPVSSIAVRSNLFHSAPVDGTGFLALASSVFLKRSSPA